MRMLDSAAGEAVRGRNGAYSAAEQFAVHDQAARPASATWVNQIHVPPGSRRISPAFSSGDAAVDGRPFGG